MKSLKITNIVYFIYLHWSLDEKSKESFNLYFGLYFILIPYKIIALLFPKLEVPNKEVVFILLGIVGIILANFFMQILKKKIDRQKFLKYKKSLTEKQLRLLPYKGIVIYSLILLILFFI
jgi:cytochrome c biogenesis protein CcdA